MFECEREEQRLRQQRRVEKQQQEQAEYFRKQRVCHSNLVVDKCNVGWRESWMCLSVREKNRDSDSRDGWRNNKNKLNTSENRGYVGAMISKWLNVMS